MDILKSHIQETPESLTITATATATAIGTATSTATATATATATTTATAMSTATGNDQKSLVHVVPGLRRWHKHTPTQTYIATYRLIWPSGRFNEN